MTVTTAHEIWREDLLPQTQDFLIKLYDWAKTEQTDDDEIVRVMESLPMTQRQLSSLYLLTSFVERNIQRWMSRERRRIMDEFELRQRAKVKPPGVRLHVHIGPDENCQYCKGS